LSYKRCKNRLAEAKIQSIRLPQAGALLLAGVIIMLAAIVAYALQRELARQPDGDVARPVAAAPARALSVDEEAYAAALWSIHREAKLTAIAMTFAGIAYKTDGQHADRLEAEVAPLAQSFAATTAKVEALDVPASIRDVHERYLGALALYENAAQVTVQAAREGNDEYLIDAQKMSFRAAEDVLRVGDVLWPGEYKPH
jgi:hypothetical protein